jgi:hypothetical protein
MDMLFIDKKIDLKKKIDFILWEIGFFLHMPNIWNN